MVVCILASLSVISFRENHTLAKQAKVKVGDLAYCGCSNCARKPPVIGPVLELDKTCAVISIPLKKLKLGAHNLILRGNLVKSKKQVFKMGDLVWCNCETCFPKKDGTERKAVFRGQILGFVGKDCVEAKQIPLKTWSVPRELYIKHLVHCRIQTLGR